MLILMAGLPGTGKSTLSRALAERCGGVVLDKDAIRAALFGPEYIEYSREQDDFCQHIMLETSQYLLTRNRDLKIFLDGRPFSSRYQRGEAREAANRLPTRLAIIECICSEKTALERLARDRETAAHLAANRSETLYGEIKAAFEPYGEIKAAFEPLSEPRLTVNTDHPLPDCLRQAEAYLASIQQKPIA